MNPRCYADMLRILEGTRLVAKAVVSLAGNETAYTSSSVGRHLIEIGLQAQNAIYSRSNLTLYSSSNMEKNLQENHQDFPVSMHDNRSNDTSKQTRPMPEYYIPNLTNNVPVNSIIAPLSNPNNVIQPTAVESPTAKNNHIPSSLHQSNQNSFSDTDPTIHPTSNPSTTTPTFVDTIDSYSSYSHIQEGRPVPSTRFGRAMGFASLGVGLMTGTAMEYASRLVVQKRQDDGEDTSLVFNSSNSDRLAKTLCRMRGAALKLGQLLSIQDEDNLSLPTPLSKALQQVRQNAEAMPLYQLRQQLKKEWKDQYNKKEDLHVGLQSMDTLPFAAASIGQVHRGVLKPDFLSSTDTHNIHRQHVVIKVQYPGVAESIESDLSNLQMLVSMTGLAPSGLFLDNIIRVGRQELKVECDYIQEAQNQKRFKEWIEQDEELQKQRFRVPAVIDTLSTKKILTSEYCPGSSIDIVSTQGDEKERNRIGRAILYLTMKELFCWRFMQTDPNWGNFLYDTKTQTTYLIDFGAAREYSKSFVDGYLRIVWASANQDEETLMQQSYRMGFLTGKESSIMMEAHKKSAYTVGEPFATDDVYHFGSSGITHRISEYGSTFLQHRLTPPPEEVYTLHRKLAGTYNLCIKLGASIKCRDLLVEILRNHIFDDGLDHPLTGIVSDK